MGLSGGDYIIARYRLLKHKPHGLDILLGVTPIPFGVEIAQIKRFLDAGKNVGDRARDFAGDESFATTRRLMIKEDAVAGVKAVRLAIVDRREMGGDLRDTVWAARIKRSFFVLGRFEDFAKHLARGGLIEFGLQSRIANRFEQPHRAGGVGVQSVFRVVEADTHMALGGEGINLFRLNVEQEADQRAGIGQIAIMKKETGIAELRV